MSIGKRMKARRIELKLSADQVGEKLGVSRATIYRYEKGDIEKFPIESLEPLAEALSTTSEYLMGWELERDIMPVYKKLEADRQTKVFDFATYQLEEQENLQTFTVYGQTAAGSPIEYGQDAVEEKETSYIPKGAEVALIINGKSMEPNYPDGSIVFYKRQPQVENGSVAIVEVDGGVTCKKVKFDYDNEKIILQSINPEFEDVIVESEQVKILGLVVK
ncbi:helix-turn-helix domain-containing protein [Jeotgalibaca porci]|uniref:helix-turn-helix domain-containing protein n=1 Tax=Jeotgalibaca porci TaxID=1868793 RepID=UPI0035A1A776